jgi:hypothetical protein
MVNNKCSKGFPSFREKTMVTEDSYACTRHHNTGHSHLIKGKQVDNCWVVCHSRYLLWKYQCHINVESIAFVKKAIKDIYKYVCTRAMIGSPWSLGGAQMRSGSIWMHVIGAAVRLFGGYICLPCRSIISLLCTFRCTFLSSLSLSILRKVPASRMW